MELWGRMNNIRFTYKLKGNQYAVSEVIGVILLIAITVSIAAAVLFYVGVFMEDDNLESPPSVSMTVDVSEDKSEVSITIIKISESGISWDDISGFLFDLSTGDSVLNSSDLGLHNDDISGGDTIRINAADLKTGNFIVGDNYRLSLVYDNTNSIIGSVSWIH